MPELCGSSHYLSLELRSLNKVLYWSSMRIRMKPFGVAGMHHEVLN